MRALYPFLFAIAAVWAMPRNAHAQLYVTSDVVSKYSATTGEVINASFITGLIAPTGLESSSSHERDNLSLPLRMPERPEFFRLHRFHPRMIVFGESRGGQCVP